MVKGCPISFWLLALILMGLGAATPALKDEDLSPLIDGMAGERTQGLAVSVLQDGRVVFQRTRGIIRMDQNSPITPRHPVLSLFPREAIHLDGGGDS